MYILAARPCHRSRFRSKNRMSPLPAADVFVEDHRLLQALFRDVLRIARHRLRLDANG